MSAQSATSLAEALQQEFTLAREFEDLLGQEHRDLIAGEADRLPALAARKSDLAYRLYEAAGLRRALASGQGIGEGRAALERACAKAGPQQLQLLRSLIACGGRSRELSELNDALVSRRLRQVRQSLSVLLQSSPAAPLTYSADGMARGARSSGTSITA